MTAPDTHKLLFVFGTRPEVIKMAPLIAAAKAHPQVRTRVVASGQHREMLDQALADFGLSVDHDLRVMRRDQTPLDTLSAILSGLADEIARERPTTVVVQGDTATTLAGALAGFYQRIPVAHVEAGLRTYDLGQPFPEEMHRQVTTRIADYNFAATPLEEHNLLAEGVDTSRIWVTGNTAIDAVFSMLTRRNVTPEASFTEPRILVTAHRRENHGAPLRDICTALREICRRKPAAKVLFPVHYNPNVRGVVHELLGDLSAVTLTEPLGYSEFVREMARATLILSDSGGVQEEAPCLNKPVLVLREKTERHAGVEAGTLLLVGTDADRIANETCRLLDDRAAYEAIARAENPYGDGTASEQILAVLIGQAVARC